MNFNKNFTVMISSLAVCTVLISTGVLGGYKQNIFKHKETKNNQLIFNNSDIDKEFPDYYLYEQYGLVYEAGKLFYDGDEIRYFVDTQVDGKNHKYVYDSSNSGIVDVIAVRENGDLVGLKKLTQQEYDKISKNGIMLYINDIQQQSNSTNLDNILNEEKSTTKSKAYKYAFICLDNSNNGLDLFDAYKDLGEFSYDNGSWYFNGELLKLFYDDNIISNHIFIGYTNNKEAVENGIAVKMIVNDNNEEEIVELSEDELNNIYNNKHFKGVGYPFT